MVHLDKLLMDQRCKCKNKTIKVEEETMGEFYHNLGIEKDLPKFLTKSRS